jgi:hypothetical protein
MPVFRTVKDQQSGSIRLEAVHQPLYDSATPTASSSTSFFQNPAGKTAFDSNLQTAGQLSWPKRFSVRALRQVCALGTVLFTDLSAYLARASIKLSVGEKVYLTLPAFVVPAGVSMEVAYVTGAAAPAAPANGINVGNHGRGDQRNVYSLLHSVYIPPVQNFGLTLDIATGYTPATAFKIHWFLEGELLREIQ